MVTDVAALGPDRGGEHLEAKAGGGVRDVGEGLEGGGRQVVEQGQGPNLVAQPEGGAGHVVGVGHTPRTGTQRRAGTDQRPRSRFVVLDPVDQHAALEALVVVDDRAVLQDRLVVHRPGGVLRQVQVELARPVLPGRLLVDRPAELRDESHRSSLAH